MQAENGYPPWIDRCQIANLKLGMATLVVSDLNLTFPVIEVFQPARTESTYPLARMWNMYDAYEGSANEAHVYIYLHVWEMPSVPSVTLLFCMDLVTWPFAGNSSSSRTAGVQIFGVDALS